MLIKILLVSQQKLNKWYFPSGRWDEKFAEEAEAGLLKLKVAEEDDKQRQQPKPI